MPLCAGLREVKVFCDPGGHFTRSGGAARRFGRVGMIFLRPSLKKAHPDLTRFITAHEAAHLARDDVMSEGLALACLATLFGVAAATRPTDLFWPYLPASALIVTLRWCQELACDRIAADAAGQIPAHEYIAYLGRADARRRSRPLLPRIRAQQGAGVPIHPVACGAAPSRELSQRPRPPPYGAGRARHTARLLCAVRMPCSPATSRRSRASAGASRSITTTSRSPGQQRQGHRPGITTSTRSGPATPTGSSKAIPCRLITPPDRRTPRRPHSPANLRVRMKKAHCTNTTFPESISPVQLPGHSSRAA